MALYEHIFIARQDISAQQVEGLVDLAQAVLEENGGKITKNEYWGLKSLAYRVKKNRKGHYAFMKTDSKASAVQEMERLMRLHEDVMRIMTIKVEEHKEGPSVQMQKREDRGERRERRD